MRRLRHGGTSGAGGASGAACGAGGNASGRARLRAVQPLPRGLEQTIVAVDGARLRPKCVLHRRVGRAATTLRRDAPRCRRRDRRDRLLANTAPLPPPWPWRNKHPAAAVENGGISGRLGVGALDELASPRKFPGVIRQGIAQRIHRRGIVRSRVHEPLSIHARRRKCAPFPRRWRPWHSADPRYPGIPPHPAENSERSGQITGVGVDARACRQNLRRPLRLILDEPVEQFVGRRRGAVLLQQRGRPQQCRHGVLAALHLRIEPSACSGSLWRSAITPR